MSTMNNDDSFRLSGKAFLLKKRSIRDLNIFPTFIPKNGTKGFSDWKNIIKGFNNFATLTKKNLQSLMGLS